jgi:hypothetical protein
MLVTGGHRLKLTPVFVTRAAADSHVDARHQGAAG